GSSYIVIGVLAAVLIMTLVYVTTVNDISSKKTAVAKAKAETQQAQARAGSLQGYGNFSQIKQQRVSSVEQLAAGRVDWERLARGLARVLPDGVWILTASASASGTSSGTDCGQSHGQPNYTWSATVAFAPIAGSVPNGSDKVPASLGGGA